MAKKIKETMKRKENIEIRVIKDGKVVDTIKIKNLIMNVALNMQRDGWDGTVTDLEIKYLAWGSSNAAVAANQTKLVGEFGRKVMTSKTPGATGILVSVCYIAPYEANVPKIEELGWFAGVGATAATDSGVMVARVLYSHQKTALESLEVIRTDTIS